MPSNICAIYLTLTWIQLCMAPETAFLWALLPLAEQILLLLFFWRCPGVIQPFLIFCFRSLNGSLPTNVEIKNNTLFFKDPVTYDLAGTYVCDATNSIGTRTGIVDVNITGRVTAAAAPLLSVANAGMALFNAVPC